jgi:hypothetical protein
VDTARTAPVKLGLAPDPQAKLQKLIDESDEAALVRLFDILNEGVPAKGEAGKAAAQKLFAEWALRGRPADLYEFVAEYQFIRAEAIRRADELEKQVLELIKTAKDNGQTLTHQDARKQLGYTGEGQPKDVDAFVRAQLEDAKTRGDLETAWKTAQSGAASKVGTVAVAGDTQVGPTVERIKAGFKQIGYAPMDDQSTLAYHVHKHHNEMPLKDQFKGGTSTAASEQQAYLDAALKTILEAPTNTVKVAASQDGTGRVYTFERTVTEKVMKAGKEVDKTFVGRALVLVGYDGNAVMLTYMPGGG